MVLIGHSLATADGLLLAVDPHVCEIMQREERELIGVTFQSLTHPADIDKNVAALMALRVQDGPLSLRKRYMRIDGSAVWSAITVSRLRADDGSRLVGTIELINAPTRDAAPESLWRSAKRVSALIERRRAVLSDDLFNDWAWLILLQIYLAEAEGRKADLPYITDAVRIRYGLAERWVGVLESRGLLERSPCTNLVPQLTTAGMSKLERLLNSNIDF
ncbi:PAS domain-containing protein [Sphingomonadaceae bacterium OTU29THOMA1]|nr:PAS domain-containing protein [Sphingomonadaceae bacterium OTU29THOMA1]